MKWLSNTKRLILAYFVLVTLAGTLYSAFEQKPIEDGMWWAGVTAMTVGYGDMYPATHAGKIVAIILMHTSVLFLLPLLIGHVCSVCIEDRNEFTHEEQEEIKYLLRKIAQEKGIQFDQDNSNRPT